MRALSVKQEKLIKSLHQKKFRDQHALFIVEGVKMCEEALKSQLEIAYFVVEEKYLNNFKEHNDIYVVDPKVMNRISTLTTPPGCLMVVKHLDQILQSPAKSELVLVLDDIKDPGNLGTILRSADAFNVNEIICSKGTVERYNPKVVQASMGSIFRIPMQYVELESYLRDKGKDYTIYTASMGGVDIFDQKMEYPMMLVLGNESNGISKEVMSIANYQISIPISENVESLNVSIACSILLFEFNKGLMGF